MNSKVRVRVVLLYQVATIWVRWATTNAGVLMISSEIAVIVRSLSLYCRVAVQAPTATPMMMPERVPISSSRRLTHMRVEICSATSTPSGDVPQ